MLVDDRERIDEISRGNWPAHLPSRHAERFPCAADGHSSFPHAGQGGCNNQIDSDNMDIYSEIVQLILITSH